MQAQSHAEQNAVHANPVAVLGENLGGDRKIEYVPLKLLMKSPYNVRRKEPTGIEGLADSILAEGLLQNLTVHRIAGAKGKNAKLGVCAGQRRHAALNLLLSRGKITDTFAVPVMTVSESDALVYSLIENEQREQMHVADLAESFSQLLESGRDIGYAAALFSCSESTVRRHVKLASLAPKLMDVFRADGMTYDQATTLVLATDHETQERLWFEAAQPWQREPYHLREAIVGQEIDIRRSSGLRFVGLEAYETAGGFVRRDLFSGDDAGYIGDVELLNSLVADKLAVCAEELKAEGWGWVEVRARENHSELFAYGTVASHARELTADEQTQHDALISEHEAAQNALNAYYDEEGEGDERGEQLEEAAATAEQALDAFVAAIQTWTPEQKAGAGAFVIVGNRGDLIIERGRVTRESVQGGSGSATATGSPYVSTTPTPKEKPVHSESLCRRLTAHRTAAVQVELAASPTVAMAVLLHRLIPSVFADRYSRYRDPSAMEIEATCTHSRLLRDADDLQDSLAWREIDAQRREIAERLPNNPADLMPWLLAQSAEVASCLFAFCVAATLNGVNSTDGPHAINAVAHALDVDLATYWKPTGASYFNFVSKARIVDVITQGGAPEVAAKLAGMKKGEAAKAAETHLEGKRWLPSVMSSRDVPVVPNYVLGYLEDDEDDADDSGNEEGRDEAAQDDEAMAAGQAAPQTGTAIDWMAAKELHTVEGVRGMGVARIDEVGSENVYVEKDGKPYFFKPGNVDAYQPGEHDFSNDTAFGD